MTLEQEEIGSHGAYFKAGEITTVEHRFPCEGPYTKACPALKDEGWSLAVADSCPGARNRLLP